MNHKGINLIMVAGFVGNVLLTIHFFSQRHITAGILSFLTSILWIVWAYYDAKNNQEK